MDRPFFEVDVNQGWRFRCVRKHEQIFVMPNMFQVPLESVQSSRVGVNSQHHDAVVGAEGGRSHGPCAVSPTVLTPPPTLERLPSSNSMRRISSLLVSCGTTWLSLACCGCCFGGFDCAPPPFSFLAIFHGPVIVIKSVTM